MECVSHGMHATLLPWPFGVLGIYFSLLFDDLSSKIIQPVIHLTLYNPNTLI